jgi:hypothetical protein
LRFFIVIIFINMSLLIGRLPVVKRAENVE